MIQSIFCILIGLAAPTSSLTTSVSPAERLQERYAQARVIRALQGHDAAQPLYLSILEDNPRDKTASLHIAASTLTLERHEKACLFDNEQQVQQLRSILLEEFNYTNTAVQNVLNVPPHLRYASCPVYVTPLSAGSSTSPPSPETGLESLVALFLLGVSLKLKVVHQHLGVSFVNLVQDLGLAFISDNAPLLVPYVHIFPLHNNSQKRDMLFVTDLHPRILSCTKVGSNDAVMYIGPDSLALVQQFSSSPSGRILDVCTGSGIQGICFGAEAKVTTCVDINPRCLQFVRFNAILDNKQNVNMMLGDLVSEEFVDYETRLPTTLPTDVDLLLANPPFIPVPPSDKDVLKRYGLFSSGGPDGEDILKAILKLANTDDVLADDAWIAIVSEFINPADAVHRLEMANTQGVLLTNEFPVISETYAARRADSDQEFDIWKHHLEQQGITEVSPGLLILKKTGAIGTTVEHRILPKSELGSMWTPWNQHAADFTKTAISEMIM